MFVHSLAAVSLREDCAPHRGCRIANRAEARSLMAILQSPFNPSISRPGPCKFPLNAGCRDDFHQSRAHTAKMIRDALVEILRIAQIMPSVFVGLDEMNQINNRLF